MWAWLFGSNGHFELPESLESSTPIKKHIRSSDGRPLEQSKRECDLMGYMQQPEQGADQVKCLIETIQGSKEDLDLDKIKDNHGISYGKSVEANFNTDILRSTPINVIKNTTCLGQVSAERQSCGFSSMLQRWFACDKKGNEPVKEINQKRLNHWLCMHMLTQGAYALIADDLKKARDCKEGEELKVKVIERAIEKTESGSIKINCKLDVGIFLPPGDNDTHRKLKKNSESPAEWSVTFPSPSEKPKLSMTVSKPLLHIRPETLGAGFGR
jgi:hypothetical protein